MRNATHEEHDGSSVEESACRIDGGLEVLCQAPVAPDPGEEPLDDPAPWLDGKADLIEVLAHDLNRDQGSLGDLLPRISAVSEDPLDEWEDSARGAQKRSAAIAILDVRRMGFEHEATPIGIDKGMTLASTDPQSRGEARFLSRWRNPVSPPRSSNRTCGFPASGFPTGFIVRPTATTVRARAEDTAPPTPRRHGRGRTGLCRVLALCAVCGGSSSCGHRHADRRLHAPRQGCHRRSTRTNHREGGSIAFALQATRPCCPASAASRFSS